MKTWIPLAAFFIISNGYGKIVEESKKIDHTRVKVKLLPGTEKGPLSCFQFGYDSLGNDLSDISIRDVTDPRKCQDLCKEEPTCFFFAFNSRNDPPENNGCWLKKDVGTPIPRANVVFGAKDCEDDELVAMITKGIVNEESPENGDIGSTKNHLNHLAKTTDEKEDNELPNSKKSKDLNDGSENSKFTREEHDNMTKDPRLVLKQLRKLVVAYGTSNRKLPKDRNLEKDIEFVKETIKQFANPNNIIKFKSVHIHKQGKPLRVKRSPIPCTGNGPDCKENFTEGDFKNLELQAEELMQQLVGEYKHVLDNLNTVDQAILHERNQ